MAIIEDRLRHMTNAHIRRAAAGLAPRRTSSVVWVTVVDGKECPSRQLLYAAAKLVSNPPGLPELSDAVITHEAVAVLSHNGFTSMKLDWM